MSVLRAGELAYRSAFSALLLGLLLLTSCGGGTPERATNGADRSTSEPLVVSSSTDGAAGSTPDPTPTVQASFDPSSYVALGDSYSSGEGAPGWDKGTGDFMVQVKSANAAASVKIERLNGCHRSEFAWPRLIGVAGGTHHLACSGAEVPDVLTRGQELREPDDRSQIERLRQLVAANPVSVATVTLGGNDAGFARIVRSCRVGPGDCLNDLIGTDLPRVEELSRDLAETYTQIGNAAQGARVLVVGYPDIFPLPGDEWVRCGWMTDTEKARVVTFARLLEGAIREAAQRAGVEFLSVRDVLHGHELCTEESWVFPVTSLASGDLASVLKNQQQAHPTRPGQEAIANAVRAYLERNPVAPTPGSAPANSALALDPSFSMTSSPGYTYRVDLVLQPPPVTTAFGDPGVIKIEQVPGWATASVSNMTPNREAPLTSDYGGYALWVKAWYELTPALSIDATTGPDPGFSPNLPRTTVTIAAIFGLDDGSPSFSVPVDGTTLLQEFTDQIFPFAVSESLQREWEGLINSGPSYYTVEAQTDAFGNNAPLDDQMGPPFRCNVTSGIDGLWGLVAVFTSDGTLVTDGDCALVQNLQARRGRD